MPVPPVAVNIWGKITKYKPLIMKLIEILRTSLTGVHYSDYQLCVGLKAGNKLKLTWERNNKYDDLAIRVDCYGVKLGYIPKGEFQDLLHQYREAGIKVTTTLVSYNKNNPTWYMLTIKCEAKKKLKDSDDITISFE